jgi:hypothetical protein
MSDKGKIVYSGYLTISDEGKAHLEEIKKNKNVKKFLEEAGDFLDQALFKGEL